MGYTPKRTSNVPATRGTSSPLAKALQDLTKYYNTVLETKLTPTVQREDRLRVSGFPYCGLKDAYHRMLEEPPEDDAYGMSYYTTVGTAAHLVFQRFMGSKGQIYGDWKCLSCKTTKEFSNSNKCPKCKSEMLYEELTVASGKHLTGHVDGLFKTKSGRYVVIDYKTSSVKSIMAHRRALKYKKDSYFPYKKNVEQITAYVVLLEEKYGIKIDGWILLYISRDKPDEYYAFVGADVSEEEKKKTAFKMRLYNASYTRAKRLKDFDDVIWLIENKPCKNYTFYTENYKGFKDCPLAAVCFSPKTLREYLKETWNDFCK